MLFHPAASPPKEWAHAASRPNSRVLLLSELFPPTVGGSAVLLGGIYSRLGSDVAVLTHGEKTSRGAERRGPFEIHRCGFSRQYRGLADPHTLAQQLQLAWHVRLLAPPGGVVHCARALPEGLAAFLSRAMGGPRYVCWAHGEDLTSALTSREYTLLTKLVYKGAAAALANSRNTADLLEQLGVPEEKIHVVHPAVDADRFHPKVDGREIRKRYAAPGDIMLLSVGRLQMRKGQDVAIEAVARLKAELPGLRYVIAGDGEERERLEVMVDQLGVREHVFFAGIVPEAELSAYYAACDIFVLPNRVHEGDIEGFGIVFLEAAASGKPVIGGNSGGVPEAVERNVTGLLVDGTVDEVVKSIRTLATCETQRQRFGLAGRVRALGLFSWQRAATVVMTLQQRLTVDQ
jgi:phosphatidylinositol alpha-1,6-mannosyltransferase